MTDHKFPYRWYLKDGYPAKGIEKHGLKVFGTFICGGGSTMGYKLSGYEHLGGVEIDPKIAEVYKLNHSPKYLYVEDIRQFNKRTDLPNELYHLDILDGSPPCSTFSTAGSREKAWGKEKQFREGQTKQTLDDLVFIYCDTIIKLQPKVFILENVTGIIKGNAKVYAKNIVRKMTDAGYIVQVFCLNAASMGVPQKRERVFFIGHKQELKYGKLKMEFKERPLLFGEVFEKDSKDKEAYNIIKSDKEHLNHIHKGDRTLADADERMRGKRSFFNQKIQYQNEVLSTIDTESRIYEYESRRKITDQELKLCGSYPQDYDFGDNEVKYLVGMSVPPVMTAQIAHQIYLQWFKMN